MKQERVNKKLPTPQMLIPKRRAHLLQPRKRIHLKRMLKVRADLQKRNSRLKKID